MNLWVDNNLSNFSPLHSGRQNGGGGGGRLEGHTDSSSAVSERGTFSAKVWGNGTVAKLSLGVREVSKREGRGRLKYVICSSASGDPPIQRPSQKMSYSPKLKLSLPKSHLCPYSSDFLPAAPTFEPYCDPLYPCWNAFRDSLLRSTRHEVKSVLYYLIKA